jgi:glycosyltransferase involved in cell wall biosynthesis
MKVSVIICTYNRAGMLDAALKSLVAARVPADLPWEIVVVDNNSSDDTPSVIKRWQADAPVPVITAREPRQGKCYALNRGITIARGEVLAFTDDDVHFDPEWVRRLAEAFATPDVMGMAGRIRAVWHEPAPRWWSDHGPYRLYSAIVHFDKGDEPRDLKSWPVGANMAFRASVFQRLGGFREDLGRFAGTLLGAEDTELGARVLAAGLRIVYAPDAIVYHPVESERVRKSYFRRWYFDHGRSVVRWTPRPPAALWFGVPRYVFRSLLEAFGKAFLMCWSRHAFYYELQVWELAGSVYEHRRARVQAPPEPAPEVRRATPSPSCSPSTTRNPTSLP